MKLKEVAKKIEDGIEETLTYYDFQANTGPTSARTMSWKGQTGRSTAAPVWWATSLTAILPSWLVCAMQLIPCGATKVHEYKAPRGAFEDTSIADGLNLAQSL